MKQELMPYVDHKFAAFKVLGKQYRSVPKDKIPEFVDEFKQYSISNFAVVLSSKRSEFESIIRQQGIQAVIDVMKNKNNTPLNITSNVN
jgi:ABC-type transporter MlaC component